MTTEQSHLNIWCPLGKTGYGVASLNFIKSLHKQGVVPHVKHMGGIHVNSEEEKALVEHCINVWGQMPAYGAPSLKIWHEFDQTTSFSGGGKTWAMPIFEPNKFNDIVKNSLKFPDGLIVNSQWAADVIKAETNRKASVVPLGVDTDIFQPPTLSYPAEMAYMTDTYNFLNVGKWEVRKGHDILVDIFNKAFTKDDDVALNLMPFNPFNSKEETEEWIKKYKESPLGDKIFILDPVQTHQELSTIMQQCDCGIFPSRAEGWNLELLEMMACGKPVITTNYSAHTEFCNHSNAFLVETPELEPANDGKWFHGQGDWAKIDDGMIDEFVVHMRRCYESRPFNPDGMMTAAEFSWDNATKKLMEIIGLNG